MRTPTLQRAGVSLFRSLGLIGIFALLFAASPALAQTATVSGQIIDADTGEPLVGATVVVAGTSRGAATDIEGNYSFALAPGAYTLRATFVGYKPEELDVTLDAGQTLLQNFGLEPDLTGLEEVVVTGALSERSLSRSEVSVGRVNAAELTDEISYQDVSQLLNGKVAGVSVSPSGGTIGAGVRFNIRGGGGVAGAGQPLIYVDGIRIANNETGDDAIYVGGQSQSTLADLNPEDIASVDVLKGPAAAALYGTEASNGVVLITTKKGQLGSGDSPALNVSYQGVAGVNTQSFEYDEFTAGQTFELANNSFVDGAVQQHTIGVSGGSNAVRFFTQFDLRDEEGIVPNNFQDRRSLRGNFEAFPLPNLSIGVNSGYTFNNIGLPINDNNVYGYVLNTILAPEPYGFVAGDSAAIYAIDTQGRSNRFLGSAEVRYEPVPGLSLRGNVGVDAFDFRQDQTFPLEFADTYALYGTTNGSRTIVNQENDQYTFRVDARYRYSPIEGLNLQTAVGADGYERIFRSFSLNTEDFSSQFITDIGTGAVYEGSDEDFLNLRQFGVLAEQSLDYQDTYFAAAGLRNDYASTLGINSPNIVYPFGRAAVRVDRFEGVPSLFSLLKVRAAYGESGQLPGNLDALTTYGSRIGGDGVGGAPATIGNSAIAPERVREFETGIDLELAQRFGVEFTYYRQWADDSIFDVDLAPSTGLVAGAQPINIGQVQGQGVELALRATPVSSRNATVDLGAIFNYQTNEVTSIGGEDVATQPLVSGLNVIDEGLPRAAFFGNVTNPVFDEDGVYTGSERTTEKQLLGIPYPEFNGSFTANVSLFRDFTVYALVDWATGLSVLNNTKRFQVIYGNDREGDILADRLGLPEAETELPDLEPGSEEYIEAATRYARITDPSTAVEGNFLEDADYLKLREISIQYNLGRYLSRLPVINGARTARIGFSARNVFTTTTYGGADPEVNFAGARSLTRGEDFLTLQSPRQFTFTLTLGI